MLIHSKPAAVPVNHFRHNAVIIATPQRLGEWAQLSSAVFVRRNNANTEVALKWRELGMASFDDITFESHAPKDMVIIDAANADTILIRVAHTAYPDHNLNFKCDYDIYISDNSTHLHAVKVYPCAYDCMKFRYVRDLPSADPFEVKRLTRNLLTGDDA